MVARAKAIAVEEQQKTWNLMASRPWAHSPSRVAKLGLAELDFCAESEKALSYKNLQNPPNRDQDISVKYKKPPKQRLRSIISKIQVTPQTEIKIY
jgi:hypothetical protein